MTKRQSGRPAGITGTAVALHPHDIQSVLKVARSERHASRAEVLVMLSTTLGLRATELSPIKIRDVYARDGSVLAIVSVCRSFLPGKRQLVDLTDLTLLRKCLADHFERELGEGVDPDAPLFQSQRGGPLSSQAIARYLTSLYRRAGIIGATSRSGRKTLKHSSNSRVFLDCHLL
jgi:integrase/recombinase XerD